MAQAPEHPGDLTASDVFATGVWSARGGKPTLGVDIACTKIAVDLQNMRRGSLDAMHPRQPQLPARFLRRRYRLRLAVLARRHDHRRGLRRPRRAGAVPRRSLALAPRSRPIPWLKGRLEHLRLSEIRDTAAPRKDQAVESQAPRRAVRSARCCMISFRVLRSARRHPGSRQCAAARRLGREPAVVAEAARQFAGHRPREAAHRSSACTSSKNASSSRRAPPTTASGTSTSRATRSISRRAGSRCWVTRWTRSSIRPTGAAWCIPKTCRACRPRSAITSPASRRFSNPCIA